MKWQSVIFITLISFFLGLSLRNCKKVTNTEGKITIDTIYKDTGSFHVKTIPKPYKVDSLIYIHDSTEIDTPKVVFEYYLKRKYKIDTVINDVEVKLNQTIFQNRLSSFDLALKNKRITTIVKKEIKLKNPAFYFGGGLSTNGITSDINGMVGYSKRKTLYIASYGFYQKTINIGVLVSF